MTTRDDERTFFAGLGRRVPMPTLLAKTLYVSLDELMAEGEYAPRKRGPVQRQLERISALPKPKQRAVMDVIEALLAQQGRWRRDEQ